MKKISLFFDTSVQRQMQDQEFRVTSTWKGILRLWTALLTQLTVRELAFPKDAQIMFGKSNWEYFCRNERRTEALEKAFDASQRLEGCISNGPNGALFLRVMFYQRGNKSPFYSLDATSRPGNVIASIIGTSK